MVFGIDVNTKLFTKQFTFIAVIYLGCGNVCGVL